VAHPDFPNLKILTESCP